VRACASEPDCAIGCARWTARALQADEDPVDEAEDERVRELNATVAALQKKLEAAEAALNAASTVSVQVSWA
jgi:outer membrane murein-binding lipoprotein Lpp